MKLYYIDMRDMRMQNEEDFIMPAIGALAGVSCAGTGFAFLAPFGILGLANAGPLGVFLAFGVAAMASLIGGGYFGALVGGMIDKGLQRRSTSK